MKKILIFVLLLAGCGQDFERQTYCSMIYFSDLNPVKFYMNGEESYNQKSVCGRHRPCWYQPWECGDPILVQIADTDGGDNEFKLYANNVLQGTFSRFQDYSGSGVDVFSPWPLNTFLDNGGAGGAWSAVGANQECTLGSGTTGSHQLIPPGDFAAPRGTQQIHYKTTNTTTACVINFLFKKNGVTVGNPINNPVPVGADVDNTFEFTLTDDADEVSIALFKVSGAGTTVTLKELESISIPKAATTAYYSYIFQPEEEFCDQMVELKVYKDDVYWAFSDEQDIKTTQDCTKGIEYWNDEEFEGYLSVDSSPDFHFFVRMYADFFEEENKVTTEVHKLSNGSIKRIKTDIEKKRTFQTHWMPYPQLTTFDFITACDHILCDGTYWTVQDGAERTNNKRMTLGNIRSLWTEKESDRNLI